MKRYMELKLNKLEKYGISQKVPARECVMVGYQMDRPCERLAQKLFLENLNKIKR